jgi:radical SAM superfamily enzyme YgiQ (UPF0313 family)
MNTYLLNPTLGGAEKFIREGRCMQKASSWATVWPPLTLATLAAIAERRGAVRLVDGNVEDLTLAAVLRDIADHKSDLVVVNTGFPSIDDDMAVAKAVKEAMPAVRVLAFGVYFTLLKEESLRNYPFLDFGIVGEPEETFEELLGAIAEGRTDFGNVAGLVWHSPSGVAATGVRPLMADLDRLPMPDRSLLRNDRYRLPHNNRPFTLVQTGRGCPYECIYCIVNPYYGRKVRKHSVDYIIREIEECVYKHKIDQVLFWEEVFTLDRSFVLAVCNAIARKGLPIQWAATTRVTAVDAEVLADMKRAGCYLLGLGIESGSQAILDAAKKRQTPDDARRAVALCREAGILTMGHFIFGLPGETNETAEETMRFMLSLGLDYMQCYAAVPYPGTELGEWAKKGGRIRAERWSQFDFGGDSIMSTEALSCEEVTRLRRRAFRKFYFRPFYLLRQLFGRVSFRQWLRVAAFRDWIRGGHARPRKGGQ